MMINIIIIIYYFFILVSHIATNESFITNGTPRQTATFALDSYTCGHWNLRDGIFETIVAKKLYERKATDGGSERKAKQIQADIPNIKHHRKSAYRRHPKDSDLGSENIESELLDEILGKADEKRLTPKTPTTLVPLAAT